MHIAKLTIYLQTLLFFSCQPSRVELLNDGAALQKTGKMTAAIEVYGKVIARDSANQLAHYRRGLCFITLKEYEKAVGDFTQTITSQPHEGMVFTPNPNFAFADEETKMKVSFLDALYQRALTYYNMGKQGNADKDFQELIDRNYSESSHCMIYQGLIQNAAGNKEKACELFDKALRNDASALTEAIRMKNAYCK